MADPLAPFIKQLWTFAVPALILAGIVGLVLGNLRVMAEKWLEGFVHRRVHGKQPEKAAGTSDPVAGLKAAVDAPHCPACNKVMVTRTAKRGGSAGREFWGCPDYPKCRGTRPRV